MDGKKRKELATSPEEVQDEVPSKKLRQSEDEALEQAPSPSTSSSSPPSATTMMAIITSNNSGGSNRTSPVVMDVDVEAGRDEQISPRVQDWDQQEQPIGEGVTAPSTITTTGGGDEQAPLDHLPLPLSREGDSLPTYFSNDMVAGAAAVSATSNDMLSDPHGGNAEPVPPRLVTSTSAYDLRRPHSNQDIRLLEQRSATQQDQQPQPPADGGAYALLNPTLPPPPPAPAAATSVPPAAPTTTAALLPNESTGPQQEHQCAICCDLLVRPVTLECGFSFCEICMACCLDSAAGRGEVGATCPVLGPRCAKGKVMSLPNVNVIMHNQLQHLHPRQYAERLSEVDTPEYKAIIARVRQRVAAQPGARQTEEGNDMLPTRGSLLHILAVLDHHLSKAVVPGIPQRCMLITLVLPLLLTLLLLHNFPGPSKGPNFNEVAADRFTWITMTTPKIQWWATRGIYACHHGCNFRSHHQPFDSTSPSAASCSSNASERTVSLGMGPVEAAWLPADASQALHMGLDKIRGWFGATTSLVVDHTLSSYHHHHSSPPISQEVTAELQRFRSVRQTILLRLRLLLASGDYITRLLWTFLFVNRCVRLLLEWAIVMHLRIKRLRSTGHDWSWIMSTEMAILMWVAAMTEILNYACYHASMALPLWQCYLTFKPYVKILDMVLVSTWALQIYRGGSVPVERVRRAKHWLGRLEGSSLMAQLVCDPRVVLVGLGSGIFDSIISDVLLTSYSGGGLWHSLGVDS